VLVVAAVLRVAVRVAGCCVLLLLLAHVAELHRRGVLVPLLGLLLHAGLRAGLLVLVLVLVLAGSRVLLHLLQVCRANAQLRQALLLSAARWLGPRAA
jgi:hypothetical protein